MAQHDMNIANQSFPSFRSDLNNSLSAINSMHSGTSRPSGAVVGTLWLDTTNSGSNSLEIKFFDGTPYYRKNSTLKKGNSKVDFFKKKGRNKRFFTCV